MVTKRIKVATDFGKLRAIAVKGFKSFRDNCELEVGGLTLLCGRNSAGKSSFLQPALLLKQTYFAPVDMGPLAFGGPNVSFDRAAECLWSGNGKGTPASELNFGFRFGQTFRVHTFSLSTEKRIELEHVRLAQLGASGYVGLIPGKSVAAATIRDFAVPLGISGAIAEKLTVHRNRCDVRLAPPAGDPTFGAFSPGPNLARLLGRWMHVPGLRGNPEREYLATRPQLGNYAGWFHMYTAGYLNLWQKREPAKLAACEADLATMGLASRLSVEEVSDVRVSIRVGRTLNPYTKSGADLVNIADVGFGVGQVLPVVVALQAAGPEDVVHIEQPELHLHPEAQVVMGRLLLAAALRGATVFAETHSIALVRGVQAAVADLEAHQFNADLVRAHWFERDESGATKVTPTPMTAEGMLPDWPEDLTQAAAQADLRFLEASMAHEFRGKR